MAAFPGFPEVHVMKQLLIGMRQGDIWVKGSCLVMGLGCIKRKQIVKGLLYLAAEALFFCPPCG